MQHQDSDYQPFGGNRPAHGARIVDTSNVLGSHQSKDEAIDFLGLGDLAPAGAEGATQAQAPVQAQAVAVETPAPATQDGSWLLDAPEAAGAPGPEAAQAAPVAQLLAREEHAPQVAPLAEARPAVYASAPAAPPARRSWTLAAAVVLCLAGGGVAWWQYGAGASSSVAVATPAQRSTPSSKSDTTPAPRAAKAAKPAPPGAAPATPVAAAPAPAKPAPAAALPVAKQPAPAVQPAPAAPVAKAAPATTPPAAAPAQPAKVAANPPAAPQPAAVQPAAALPAAPTVVKRAPAAPPAANSAKAKTPAPKVAAPATTPSRPLAPRAYQSQPVHAAVQTRLVVVQRTARRYGWSLLGLHGSLPSQRHPAGAGIAPGASEPVVASVLPVSAPVVAATVDTSLEAQQLDAPRIVRDLQEQQPERANGPRRARPEDQPYTHQGADVPMQRIHEVRRILTPKVGRVRVTVTSGEVFEGVLYAVGEGSVWLDTDLGRMALQSEGVRNVETLSSSETAPALGDKGSQNLAGLRRVRVTCAGGVFTGALLSQQGNDVVLVTDEGSRIRLQAQKIESISREGTQIRGRVTEPAKKP